MAVRCRVGAIDKCEWPAAVDAFTKVASKAHSQNRCLRCLWDLFVLMVLGVDARVDVPERHSGAIRLDATLTQKYRVLRYYVLT